METPITLIMKESAPKADGIYESSRDSVLKLGQMHNIPEAVQRAIAEKPKRERSNGRRLTVRNAARAGLQMARLFMEDLSKHRLYVDCSSFKTDTR
jgi:hypothetical protein